VDGCGRFAHTPFGAGNGNDHTPSSIFTRMKMLKSKTVKI
jgi:hypothetical protein